MMRRAVSLVAVVACLGAAVAPGAASAATHTSNFDVSAQVTASAEVSATPLAFGSYNPINASPTDKDATITVTASLGTTYSIGIDAGLGNGATPATRKLSAPGRELNYSVHQDSQRSQVWGSSGSAAKVGSGTGNAQTFTAYGRIPAQQAVVPGTYQDTLTVTVSY